MNSIMLKINCTAFSRDKENLLVEVCVLWG